MHHGKSRMSRERQTIEAMIALYCRSHHNSKERLCSECSALASYARDRLTACRYQQDKPTCGQCPIHCYKPAMRTQIKEVMRYAGPRMLWHHPVLAIRHMKDGRKRPPTRPARK